jgi:DNA polymerase I-like protein with 3'-5' exonuclease and polymerase domains
LNWTLEEAAENRKKYLEVFTDIAAFLEDSKISQDALLRRLTGEGRRGWAETLELTDWNVIRAMGRHPDPEIQEIGRLAEQSQTVELPTGRVRAQCRFTEAANTWFQGLASDVTKDALWRIYRAGLAVAFVVHDEIALEVLPSEAPAAAVALEECMLSAFRKICPAVGQFAKVETKIGLTRWGPTTDLNGKEVDLRNI